MNHKIKNSVMAFPLFLGLMACSQPSTQQATIELSNNIDQPLVSYPVVIPRSIITAKLGDLAENQTISIQHGGDEITYQMDDLDEDGNWDELALLIDLPEHSVTELRLDKKANTNKNTSYRTNIRIGRFEDPNDATNVTELRKIIRRSKALADNYSRGFQMEGPAWENDRIGFRLYFDERNGFDIFGKRTEQLVLDGVGINENYHQRQSWGMDVLKVGRSLGAGALAFYTRDNQLQRLTNAEQTSAQIVAEGPIRSILRVHYQKLTIEEKTIDITHEIILWAEQDNYQSRLSLSGTDEPIKIAVGFANFYQLPSTFLDDSEFVTLSSLGRQGEENTVLGMGIVIPSHFAATHGNVGAQKNEIENSEYVVINLRQGNPVTYQFFARWDGQEPSQISNTSFNHRITQQRLALNREVLSLR